MLVGFKQKLLINYRGFSPRYNINIRQLNMKKSFAAVALMLPFISQAAPVVSSPGALNTLGSGATPQTGLSVIYNPASAEMVIQPDNTARWGYMASTGLSVEVGDVSNFADDVEELIDNLDLDDVTASQGDDIIDDYNNNLRHKLGDEGYTKINFHIVAPIAPLLIRSDFLGGVVSMDLMGGVTAKISVLDDDIILNSTTDKFETNTAAYVKSVQYTTFGLGYGREVDAGWFNDLTRDMDGRLLAGVRANIYNLKLSKQVVGLTNIDEDDKLADIIADDYDKNQSSSTAVGLDLGLIWQAPNYHLGLAWKNINEPEFDYGAIGQNCNANDTNTAINNCFTAQYFANERRISFNEKHVMTGQVTLDAALNSEDKRWRLATAYDMQAMRDPIGDEYQWASASVAYVSSSIFGGRLGFSQNQVGSELTTLNAGLSLFGVVNLDVRYGLDSVEIDGESAPRTVGINLGFESSF
ncbi:MAG: hypothetical protein ACI84K_001101 [Pseudohongiellaceae bacterium]